MILIVYLVILNQKHIVLINKAQLCFFCDIILLGDIMDKIIFEVLNRIEENGFQAYVVGGYVRDLMMGIKSIDIDVCTDALPKDIKKIFDLPAESSEYGSINFKLSNYNFDITTFREEIKYLMRKPVEIKYIKDLYIDVLRRDFTINTMCLDKNGKLVDMLNGKNDLDNKLIKLIGDNGRLKEDPLRILRTIRFATTLDFEIDIKLCDGINIYKELLNTLSSSRIKNELNKILVSKNYKKGLKLLKKFDLLDLIGIQYNKLVYVEDLCGMWAQIDIIKDIPFTKEEKSNILKIKEILNIGYIDNYIIYKYGLYISSVAAKILELDIDVIEKYENLMIHTNKDLNINVVQIKDIIEKSFEDAKIVQEEIIKNIVNNKLNNNYDDILKFIKQGMVE